MPRQDKTFASYDTVGDDNCYVFHFPKKDIHYIDNIPDLHYLCNYNKVWLLIDNLDTYHQHIDVVGQCKQF